MEKSNISQTTYALEIVEIIRHHLNDEELPNLLSNYHENDIAEAFENLTVEERKTIYPILGAEYVAEIFSYIEDAHEKISDCIERIKDYAEDSLPVLDEKTITLANYSSFPRYGCFKCRWYL